MAEHDPHEHTSFIKTPKQLIAVIVLAFVVPVLVISMIASLASRSVEPGAFSDEAVTKRIRPVGEVVVSAAPAGGGGQRSGQEIVQSVCSACHATGALNAPKIGDHNAWAPLIKQGLKDLVHDAINGVRQMPPRGGNPDLSDTEVARAVVYMANQAGAQFSEPAAPAAAPGASATAQAAAPQVAAPAPAGKPAAPGAAAGASANGKTVFDANCIACHGTGVAGAPKIGDKAAWAPRLKQGVAALHESALKGKGAMPPKGGNTSLSDADVNAAVDYMTSQAQ